MYQSEFPVDQPVPIFDPTLLVAFLLAVVVIAAIAYSIGRFWGRKDRAEDFRETPRIIHEAIKAKCVAATSAPSGQLVSKAEELVEEIKARIGPVIDFGGPCAKALKGLKEALKGEPPAEDKDKPGGKDKHGGKDAHGGGHGHGPAGGHGDHGAHGGHGEGHGGHDVACKCERCVSVLVAAAAPNVTILGPGLGGQTIVLAAQTKPPADDHHAPPEEPVKVLGHKDFSVQVRMAVVEFSDFWSRGDCLLELQACQRVLTETKPLDKHKNSGGH